MPGGRIGVFVAVLSWACSDPYRSQIGDVPGPDEAMEPDPAARARWTTAHVGGGALRALACDPSGRGAWAVGPGGAATIAADGTVTEGPRAPVGVTAIAATPAGWVAAGRGALHEGRSAAELVRTALPRADAVPLALAPGEGDTLWVAGRVPKGGVTVGWVARRSRGRWIDRLVEDVPAVTQILARGDEAVLVVEATPYSWKPGDVGGGALEYYMPAQPDAHPPIAALARTPRGFVAVGPDNAWRLEGTTLVRELRQLYMRLESVAALPGGQAIAVGSDNPPGGRTGGLAIARNTRGQWQRELFTNAEPLHAVTHCQTQTIAVGDGGLIGIRRGDGVK